MFNPLSSLRRVLSAVADRFAELWPEPEPTSYCIPPAVLYTHAVPHTPTVPMGIPYDAAETKPSTANIIRTSIVLLMSLVASYIAILFVPSDTGFRPLVVDVPVLISVGMFISLLRLLLIPRKITHAESMALIRKDTFRQLRRDAKKGDSTAWMELGKCYLDGFGVSRDLEKAAACFKTAANLNQPDAQCLLAYCHHIGTGVSRVEALVQALRDVGQLPKEEEDGKESQLAISTDESLAAAFARCHTGKTLTIREAATPPRPIMRFLRDQESYALFEDHSICAWSWSGPSATPHTLASLAAAVETRRKDGLPLSAAARDLLIHIVSNSQGWDEAEVDTALLLLAAADRDARLSAA